MSEPESVEKKEPLPGPFFAWWSELLRVYDDHTLQRFAQVDIADMAFAAGQNYQAALMRSKRNPKRDCPLLHIPTSLTDEQLNAIKSCT